MSDPNSIVITCERPGRIIGAMNAVTAQLPPDVSWQLAKIQSRYLQLYGMDGLFKRVNNRSVAQILAEFDPKDDAAPMASGEIDGIRWELYDSPDGNDANEIRP